MIFDIESLNWILVVISGIIFLISVYATIVSIIEKEFLAASRFFSMSFLIHK